MISCRVTEQKKPVSVKQRVSHRRRLRAGIQVIFFLLAPSVYTAAFSGIKEIATAIGASQPLSLSSFVTALIAVCVYTMVFGRFFCGYACAFGGLGDAVYALSQFIQRKTGLRLPAMPQPIVRIMQKIKYVILLVIVILCVTGVYAQLSGWSPWDVFSMLTAFNWSGTAYALGTALLVLIVAGMAVKERFFCQFLCPMGAVFALLPVVGRYTRNRSNCLNGCSACVRGCPVCVETDDSSPHMGECISCGKCSDICPKRNISYAGRICDGNAAIPVAIRAAILFVLCAVLGMVRIL